MYLVYGERFEYLRDGACITTSRRSSGPQQDGLACSGFWVAVCMDSGEAGSACLTARVICFASVTYCVITIFHYASRVFKTVST